jgi:hypothetical protein
MHIEGESRPSTNGSSPAPENSLDGQSLLETDPFIEYGRATQEEDPDASLRLISQRIYCRRIRLFSTSMKISLSSALSPKILSTSRHSYISKIAPESSIPLRTHAKQKKDSLKNPKTPKTLPQMKPKKQQKLSFLATQKPPAPVIPAEPEESAQAQGGREQEVESYEELIVDSLVSIATGLDGSLDEDSLEPLTIREVYDSVSLDRSESEAGYSSTKSPHWPHHAEAVCSGFIERRAIPQR